MATSNGVETKISIFKGRQIRRHWDAEKELWFFAVADVIAVLTNSVSPLAYWRKLKERLLKEGGNETVTKCHALKMMAPDGKMLAETATTEISQKREPKTFPENRQQVAREGGGIAGSARKQIEAKTGKPVINGANFRTAKNKQLPRGKNRG